MPAKLELTGQQFGALTAVKENGRSAGGAIKWLCNCECGQQVSVVSYALRSGHTSSCGCRKVTQTRLRNSTHGKSGTSEYNIWQTMKDRCFNPQNRVYKHYGGRGITVCKAWADSFDAFYSDMGPRPHGSSLDRIDNNAGYSPDNCRWADAVTQGSNKRSNTLLTHNGETRTLSEWSRLRGISVSRICQRIKRGMSVADALSNKHFKRLYLTFNGEEASLADWAARTGINKTTILERLRHGWTVERTLTQRVRK